MTYFHWDCDGIQRPQKITRPLSEALLLSFKAVRENRATNFFFLFFLGGVGWGVSFDLSNLHSRIKL